MTAPVVPKLPKHLPPGMSYELDDLLDRIQKSYQQRQQLHGTRIAELQQALEAYAKAAKQDLVVDFAKRNGVEDAGELQAPDAALYLSVLVSELPEMGGRATLPSAAPAWQMEPRPVALKEAPEEVDEDEPNSLPLPRIHEAARNLTEPEYVVLVGGTPSPQKIRWLKSVLGYEPDWIETEDDPDARSCQAFVKRMEHGEVCGVVFFEGFMSHPQTDALIEGGRIYNVPVVAAGRAGKGTITRALREIEGRL